MLRNIIGSNYETHVYKLGANDLKRGTIVTKNLSTATADKASGKGTEVYVLDFDFQPTGALANVDVSAYSVEADTVKAGTLGILVKYNLGCQFAIDQVDVTTPIVAGDYLIAGTSGTAGKLVKAVATNVTSLKYNGIYLDGSKTLYVVEVVEAKTL